jgi:phosphoglycerate dehydrogenase-like enzyme
MRRTSDLKPKTLVLPPRSGLDIVCSAECRRLLEEHFDVSWNETGSNYTTEQLESMIGDAEIVLTSWASPVLTEQALRKAPRLRFIGHAAGTLKNRLPENVFSIGNIRLFSAAPRIALSVGEYCLAVVLNGLWKFSRLDSQVRSGIWRNGAFGRELRGQTIGIVSASSTARAFIALLKPFQVSVKVYDPYLTAEAAESLGVARASLEEVMRCPIISVHAPSLPATKGMLTADLLKLIPDGALFVNSSRGAVLDEEALIKELQTGRFHAVLDVFVKEPPLPDNPLLKLDNVLLTPHVAGMTTEGCLSLMHEIVQDILRAMRGEQTCYEVSEQAWKIMA